MEDSFAEQQLFCSFCGKSVDEIQKLIAGPAVYICDECTFFCAEIMEEEGATLFNDRENAIKFIGNMGSIEKLDVDAFLETCGYIKGVLRSLRAVEQQEREIPEGEGQD